MDFNPAMAGAGGAVSGFLGDLFPNPADSAMPYLDQVPGQMAPYFNPYIQSGKEAMGNYQNQSNRLINDPTSVMNQVGQGYHQSPGFNWALSQALQAGNQSAAAGGMLGSPANQQQQMTTATGLANQDYYNYLNHALDQYGLGMKGQSDINQLGYGASTNMGESLGQLAQNKGNLAYAGQANQNQMTGGIIGDIFGLFGGGSGGGGGGGKGAGAGGFY